MIAIKRAQQRALARAIAAVHHPALAPAYRELLPLQYTAVVEIDVSLFASDEHRSCFH